MANEPSVSDKAATTDTINDPQEEKIDVMAILTAKGKVIGDLTINELSDMDECSSPLLKEMMIDYPLRGGKHLRPVLCAQTCTMFGGDPKRTVNTGIALELFQHWILIHDDIEDYSEERRGKPALHKIYGVPLAINTGDTLHVKMWDVLLRNRDILGDKVSYEVNREFVKMMTRCTGGQHMELEWVTNKIWDVSEEDYYKMCKGKTCGYTFITPFRLGAIIAEAKESQLAAFEEIGNDLGLAFQIEDDILNLVGEEGKYGKEIAGDIWEGKRTLMLLHLLRNCTPGEKTKVFGIMNKERHEKADEGVAYVLEMMKKYHSIEYAKEKAIAFAKRAKESFNKEYAFLKDSETKRFVQGLVDFVINRDM